MRTAVYTRISSDQSGDGRGVQRQLEDCLELAERLNWTVTQTFSDNDISAYSGKTRPAYQDMMTRIAAGEFDALVCWHTDRLHRSIIELEQFMEVVVAAKLEIRTVQGGTLDFSNANGMMVARILGSVARQESDHASERRRRANDQRAAEGVWHTSKRPFGFTPDGKRLEPEASAIRTATADVLAGKSLRQVSREWNEQGLRTAGRELPWTSTNVRRVLLNPRNAALRVHRRRVVGPGKWESIVDPDEHRALAAILSDPERSTFVTYERKWQGSGIYQCGVCDAPVVLHVSTGQRRAYKCPKNHVRRQGQALDELVDDVIVARLSKPDAQAVFLGDVVQIDVGAMQVERDALRGQLNTFATMLGLGTMDGQQFERASKEVRARMVTLDNSLAKARMDDPIADLVLSGDALATRWSELAPDLRGKIIAQMLRVAILPSPKGQRRFNPEYVDISWV